MKKNDQANEEAVIANEEPQEVPAVTKGVIKGHEWVDLGLPSGLKWATSNVGASSPEKYGSYYAWGETKSKSSFDDDNCESIDKDGEWLSNNGYIAGSGNLILSHDVARQNWGGSWRMPTLNDFRELKSNTTSEWTTFNGVHGRLFKSKKNGNSIFLPAAGWRLGPSPYSSGSVGYYLSSTPYEGQIFGCYYMDFDWGTCDISWGKRQSGRSVRPVSN